MKQLTTFLILILASTDASKYFRPDRQFQQDLMPRNKYQDMMAMAFDEDRSLPRLSSADEMSKWESPPDPTSLIFPDLTSLENLLQEDPNEYRIKRTKTSLSIDNPLDVLRQQYYRALARRMKFKSIEKNREHLLKTGKRSLRDEQYQINLNKPSGFQPKASQKDYLESGMGESERQSFVNSNEQNPTTRRYQNHLENLSYQT